jgi:TonB-dependent receptor
LLELKPLKVKHNLLIKIFALLIFSNFISQQVWAQKPGKITGKITDSKTGETLISALVKIEGTDKKAYTDVEGKYNFNVLAPGKYTLNYEYMGFKSKIVTDVEVKAGDVSSLDIVMDKSDNELDEVVIKISQKQENINTVYAQQKNSSRISDGISAELIRKSPDKNTGEVLKRISGATIQDNKFVIVRGLSDRYNTAQLDNSPLPSTEPNRKAFSFDIVPSNMVDNIIISKTATPDMSGDFAGGTIQIITKDIPDQNYFSIGLGTGYNSQSTFKDFRGTQKGTMDYLGFNNSTELATNFPGTNRINAGLTGAQNIAAINSLAKDWTIYRNKALLGQNYQVNLGKVKYFKKEGNKLGTSLSVTYRNSQISNPELTRELFTQYQYTDQTYKFSTNLGALANFAYFFGNSKITFKNIYNRIQDDQFLSRTGSNFNTSSSNKFYAFDLSQKSLLKSTLDGEHKFGEKANKLKWTLGYSNIINNQPDQRKISYYKNLSSMNDPSIQYAANVTSIGKENTRLFSNLSENIYSGDVNLSLPVTFAKSPATLKLGANSTYRDRAFNVRFIGLQLNNNATDYNAIRERQLGSLFATSLINQGVYNLSEIGNSADRYLANSLTNAAYAMLDNKLGKNLRVVWGLRAEQFNLNLQTFDATQPKTERNQLDLLPSANFTYSLNSKSNLRASYYRTIARPEFRELSPFAYYDYEQLAIQFGNPSLKRTQIHNADLRYELYPSPGQIISVSVFYKQFKNAIETTFYDVNSTPDITYTNADANTYGAELEFRKSLKFVKDVPFYNNTTLYTNLSIIRSKVSYGGTNPLLQDRPLVGQSPYVINAGIQHSALENKLSFNLLYNRIGRRIYRVGGIVYPNLWENSRDVFDFQTGMKILKSKAELKLNIGDLLNQKSVYYFDRNNNKKYTPGTDDALSKGFTGRNVSLSFNYTF